MMNAAISWCCHHLCTLLTVLFGTSFKFQNVNLFSNIRNPDSHIRINDYEKQKMDVIMLVKDVGDEICMLMTKFYLHSAGVHKIWKISFCLSWKVFSPTYFTIESPSKLKINAFRFSNESMSTNGYRCWLFFISLITNVVSKIFKVSTLKPKGTVNGSFEKRICWD